MSDLPIENWRGLRNAGKGDGVLEVPSFPTEVNTGYGFVRYALGPGLEPRLLVPMSSNGRVPLGGSVGKLSIRLTRFNIEGRSVPFVDLVSTDRPLDPVFAELAVAVINRIRDGAAPIEAIEGTVSEFRELLWLSDGSRVPDLTIYGLVGELLVLRELSRLNTAAIQSWIGPYEERHDFRRGVHAIEVKTSSRADAAVVSISSVEQLIEPVGGTLTLIHVRLERADLGEISVKRLCDELLSLGVDRRALESGLAGANCTDPASAEWNGLSFNLENIAGYRVTEGFPRVSGGMFAKGALPVGVVRIEYSIDLGAAAEFTLSAPEKEHVYKRFLG